MLQDSISTGRTGDDSETVRRVVGRAYLSASLVRCGERRRPLHAKGQVMLRASNKTPDVENHIGFYLTICIRVCQVTRNRTVLFRGILQREIFQEASHAASKLTTADPHLHIAGLCFQCALRLLDDPAPLHPGGILPVRLWHHLMPCLGSNGPAEDEESR